MLSYYLRHGLIALLLFASTGHVLAQQAQDSEYQQQIDKLKANIETLKKELRAAKSSRSDLQQDLQDTEVDIGELLKKIDRLKTNLDKQSKQLNELNIQRDELSKAETEQKKHMAEQIEAAYRLGGQSNIKLLLNQENPEQFSRMIKYYNFFLEARSEKVQAYLDTIAELDRITPRIETKRKQLSSSQKKLKSEHAQLKLAQSERKKTLARLERSIDNKDQQLKDNAKTQAHLQNLLAQVAEAVSKLPTPEGSQPFKKRKGKMSWPTSGRLKHKYGSFRASNKLRWDGHVFAANLGNSVKAVHSGRVIFADYLRGHGLLLIIDHGDGYMSLYAHNQSLLRETGDWVGTGEKVALVGQSGGLSQASLYFEIRHKGKPTNPSRWLKRA